MAEFDGMDSTVSSTLDLGNFPLIFILPSHLSTEELHQAEDIVTDSRGRLTYHAAEARVFLGRITHGKRAAFDLRTRGVWTEHVHVQSQKSSHKRRRLSSDGVQREHGIATLDNENDDKLKHRKGRIESADVLASLGNLDNSVVVLKLEWLTRSVERNMLLSVEPYIIYSGRIQAQPLHDDNLSTHADAIKYIKVGAENSQYTTHGRVEGDTAVDQTVVESRVPSKSTITPFQRRRFGHASTGPAIQSHQPPRLHRTTTSEAEGASNTTLPLPPDWLLEPDPRPLYSCVRSTPAKNPNEHFIAQLSQIREARLLTLDEIGVRAYSTSIAAISAYPHRIASVAEVLRLPGCDEKLATLWHEWYTSVTSATESNSDADLDAIRMIPVVKRLSEDHSLNVLKTFHQIWGVGPETAQKFHYTNGWNELDDVVEFGWSSLTRVQQIGVKFYHEFLTPIPKLEVEEIAKVVLQHARKCRKIPPQYWSRRRRSDIAHTIAAIGTSRTSPQRHKVRNQVEEIPVWSWDDPHSTHTDPRDFVAVIVGGYRRGKDSMGDVDVIISHRDERYTQDLIVDLVASLEGDGYITHTLSLFTTTSDRNGATLPYSTNASGNSFDTLDKALCVWQDPMWSTGPLEFSKTTRKESDKGKRVDQDQEAAKQTKNPNIHRRVDIIISPWKTFGCAIMGWSGGTTFQRDTRRWAKREKGWKFDSSGVRDRKDGMVLDLENDADLDASTVSDDSPRPSQLMGWEDKERRVMEGMGIGWRPANERCTG